MSTPSTGEVPPGAPAVNGTVPRWRQDAGHDWPGTPTVAALCEQFSAICESAVDPLEVASALEFDGFSDNSVRREYGVGDVFALARVMYQRVPRRPAPPAPAPDPWQAPRLRPLLHALLYALPAVCFPAAAGLLHGRGVVASLVLALLVAWGLSQGLASVGYLRRAGSADEGQVKRALRAGLAAGLVLVALAMLAAGLCFHPGTAVPLFGAGEGAYMLGASVLMVLGAETWLPVALIPAVAGSAVFLCLGRPPDLAHLAWWALGLTPLLACAIAVACTRRNGPRAGRPLVAAEVRAAAPAVAFGVVAAGLLTFPIVAGPEGRGGFNTAALLVSIPLSLSMGAAEWSLLWYRHRARRLLGSTGWLRTFRYRMRLTLLAAVSQYLCGTAVLVAAGLAVAAWTGLASPGLTDLPVMAAYLMLGSAMFVALLLQAVGIRAVPLLLLATGLAVQILLHERGTVIQVLVPAALLVVLGGLAVKSLGAAARHG